MYLKSPGCSETRSDEKEIEKELDTYLNLYRVSLETAKRSVVRKLGGDPNALAKGIRKPIAELSGTEMSVDVLVKALTVNQKEIEQNGESKRILYGLMADESGSLAYTAWDADRFQLETRQGVLGPERLHQGMNGQPQLNLGNRATIEPQPDDSLKAARGDGHPLLRTDDRHVVELKEGMNSVTITVKVLSVRGKEAGDAKRCQASVLGDRCGRDRQGTILSMARLRTEGWRRRHHPRGLRAQLARQYRRLNFGERAGVERSKATFGSDQELGKPKLRSIGELELVGGRCRRARPWSGR